MKKKCLILADSVIGRSHKTNIPPLPCQDSFSIEKISDQWGVCVICDGLSTKKYSDHGAKFVSEYMAKLLAIFVKNRLLKQENLLSDYMWHAISMKYMNKAFEKLKLYAEVNNIELKELGCTVIAVIYSPLGLLVTHLGDGRAGYYDEHEKDWYPAMVPFRDEEGCIPCITSEIWSDVNSTAFYIKSHVIRKKIKAFCLMSDGCEKFSFDTGHWDNEKERFIPLNKPSSVFFNPVINYIEEIYKNKDKYDDWEKHLRIAWFELLSHGTKRIEEEFDDKTMIFGYFYDL